MASAGTRQLDRRRYSPEHEQILAEIARRSGWSAEQLIEYQHKHTADRSPAMGRRGTLIESNIRRD